MTRQASTISKAEAVLCARFADVLSSVPLNSESWTSGAFREVLSALEFFIPEVLRGKYDEWRYESLDGIYPARVRRSGNREVEIVGICCLISDQTLTPLRLKIELSQTNAHIAWMECLLGEHTAEGMRRVPYSASVVNTKMLHVLKRLDTIDWYYDVEYDERSA